MQLLFLCTKFLCNQLHSQYVVQYECNVFLPHYSIYYSYLFPKTHKETDIYLQYFLNYLMLPWSVQSSLVWILFVALPGILHYFLVGTLPLQQRSFLVLCITTYLKRVFCGSMSCPIYFSMVWASDDSLILTSYPLLLTIEAVA